MAFWGVEVKPGKPFTHLPDTKGGRLHVSQATLGFGTAAKKSVVQCNVGNSSPVFLCSLFPEQSESSQLNLEFEETDEVVFSVIGPRSVHLTGYYLGASSRHYKLDDESESYGEDILDTETERSPGVSDEEEYEDSFIDDDDLQVIAPSPAFSDGVSGETLHEGRKKETKAKHKRLRKKYHSSQTDEYDDYTSQQHAFSNGGTGIMDSEGEDMTVISSLVKSAAKIRKPGAEEKAEKDTGQTIVKELKAGHDNSAATEGKTDAIIDSEPERKRHEYDSILPSNVENDAKPKKKRKKQPQEEKEVRAGVEDEFFSGQVLTWDKAQQNEMKVDQSSQDMALINGDAKKSGNDNGESLLHFTVPSAENICGIVAKTRKRRKKQTEETKVVGPDSPLSNVNGEDQTQANKARCENVEQDGSLKNEENQKQANDEGAMPLNIMPLNISAPSDDLVTGIVSKTGKRTTKQAKVTKTLRADNPFNNGNGEDQAQPDEARCEMIEQDSLLKNEENEKQANDEGENQLHFSLPSDELVHGIVAKTGKRKKKQAKKEKGLGADIPLNNISREDQAQSYEARCENIEQGSLLKSEDNQKQATDEGVNQLRSDELVHGIVAKTRKRKKKQAEEEKAIAVDSIFSNFNGEDEGHPDESRCENIVQDNMLKNEEDQKQANDGLVLSRCENIVQDNMLKNEEDQKQANDGGVNQLRSDELVHGIVAKTRKRKKKQAAEENAIGVDSTFSNFNGEDEGQPNESRCENIVQDNMLKNEEDQKQANDGNSVLEWPSVVLGLETVPKPMKKIKKTAKDKALEADANNIKIVTEDKDNGDEQNQMQTIDADFDNNDDQSGNENHNGKKVKKKSRIQEKGEALNMDESMNISALDIKQNNATGKSKKVSKAKKQDGKVAAP